MSSLASRTAAMIDAATTIADANLFLWALHFYAHLSPRLTV